MLPQKIFLYASRSFCSVLHLCPFTCLCSWLIASFAQANNLHFINMIFLVSLQILFTSLFLYIVHLLFFSLNLLPFSRYDVTCLRNRSSLQPFFLLHIFEEHIVLSSLVENQAWVLKKALSVFFSSSFQFPDRFEKHFMRFNFDFFYPYRIDIFCLYRTLNFHWRIVDIQ